jgi:hypothetical protein
MFESTMSNSDSTRLWSAVLSICTALELLRESTMVRMLCAKLISPRDRVTGLKKSVLRVTVQMNVLATKSCTVCPPFYPTILSF